MTGVDVVVVDWRTPEDLDGFLEAFNESAGPDDALHVVLVEPTTEDRAVMRTWESHPQLSSLTSFHTNVGYGIACNAGAARGDRDVIGLFNADTRLSPDATTRCAAMLESRDDYGVLGPRQVNDFGQLTHAGIRGTNARPTMAWWKQPDRGQYSTVDDTVVSVSGAAYFVKRSVWDELTACPSYLAGLAGMGHNPEGAFVPSPLYYEDMWCSVHARAHGFRVVFDGTTCIIHRWHKAVEAAGAGEPTAKYHAAKSMYRALCDAHEPPIEHE